jgi:hypothetical protein
MVDYGCMIMVCSRSAPGFYLLSVMGAEHLLSTSLSRPMYLNLSANGLLYSAFIPSCTSSTVTPVVCCP